MRHSGRPYSPESEAGLLDLERAYTYLARDRWFRHTTAQGRQFSQGAQCYNAGQDGANQQLEITFTPRTHELVCRAEDGQRETRLPLQGLTRLTLMDELLPTVTLPAYQLALPFSSDTWYPQTPAPM